MTVQGGLKLTGWTLDEARRWEEARYILIPSNVKIW